MTEQQQPAEGPGEIPGVVVRPRRRISIVWLIPLLAIAIGGWLAWEAFTKKGPTIQISFKNADGLEAGKTKVKFKSVEAGTVNSVVLSSDLSEVIVTATLDKELENHLTENTRFWITRARISGGKATGLETLLSGAYIGIDPGDAGKPQRKFKGLEEPVVVSRDEPGEYYKLKSHSLGSITAGTPIYFRQIQVGEVTGYRFDDAANEVVAEIFINAPYNEHVFTTTRFWNASGIDVELNANGMKLHTESLVSLITGGIAFDTPPDSKVKTLAESERAFLLYKTRDDSKKEVYSRKAYFLMYFDSSVRGLKKNAPVELRGIQVGQVVDVNLLFDTKTFEFRIPVLIEFEEGRLDYVGDPEILESPERQFTNLERLVRHGLRGQLKTGSLLTGQLYIELDFFPDAKVAEVVRENQYLVIPTVPATIDELTQGLTAIVDKVNKMPLVDIGNNLNKTLVQSEAAMRQFNEVTLPGFNQTVAAADTTLDSIQGVVSEQSPAYIELVRALRELSSAARSIRITADYLEQHPDALIKGKR